MSDIEDYTDDEDSFSDDEDEEIDEHVEFMDILSPIVPITSNYYIGCYTVLPEDPYTLLLANKIHRNTFMKFNGTQLSNYLFGYSVIQLPYKPSIDILQLYIESVDELEEGGLYTVVVKTFWIKCIQWAWKRLYKKRQEYISYRKLLSTIQQTQLTGKARMAYPEVRGILRPKHAGIF